MFELFSAALPKLIVARAVTLLTFVLLVAILVVLLLTLALLAVMVKLCPNSVAELPSTKTETSVINAVLFEIVFEMSASAMLLSTFPTVSIF
jgi:hypothetical protein